MKYLGKISKELDTLCPRSLDPFDTVTYYIKWLKTSWTDSKVKKFHINAV